MARRSIVWSSVTVIALLGITVRAQTGPGYRFVACNAIQQQTCQAVFNDNMGIDPSLGIKTFQELRRAIELSFADFAADGLLNTCYAFKEFKNCFPQTPTNQYFACAQDPLGLLIDANKTATGILRFEAEGYTKVWSQLDFVCGAGFSYFANNDYCVSTIFNNQTDSLRNCDDSFRDNVRKNPEQACSYVEIAANCYQSLFWNTCRKPEVAWWGCNYERSGTQQQFPQCTEIWCTFHEFLTSMTQDVDIQEITHI